MIAWLRGPPSHGHTVIQSHDCVVPPSRGHIVTRSHGHKVTVSHHDTVAYLSLNCDMNRFSLVCLVLSRGISQCLQPETYPLPFAFWSFWFCYTLHNYAPRQ